MVFKLNYTILTVVIAIIFVFTCLSLGNPTAQSNANINEYTALPVIMYHHILKSKQGDYIVSPTQFENDLKYLRDRGYQTITTAELLSFIEKGTPLPQKPIMITFDDGYESVYAYGFPLLKEYNMTAVTSVIGKHTDIFSNPDETKHLNYSHSSWNQLREMQESGVFEIGNHTYNMHDHGDGKRYGIKIKQGEDITEYENTLGKDIGGLNAQITKEIGITPTVFAYPFGALCKESKLILKNMGFKIILTCEEKVNKIEQGTALPISLKRFNRAAKYETADFFNKMGID